MPQIHSSLLLPSFSTGPQELFGLQNFGATFAVPGFVTIGPNFRIFGRIEGTATLHGKARVDATLAKWDYSQQFPNEGELPAAKEEPDGASTSIFNPSFYYDVEAGGQISAHVYVDPP